MYEKFVSKIGKCAEKCQPPRGLDINDFYELQNLYMDMVISHNCVKTSNKKVAKFFKKWHFYVAEKDGKYLIAQYTRA